MPAILTDLNEGVQTLTLNQPNKFNALSNAMLDELAAAARNAERDASIRVLVLTGAGRGFCSGADISEFSEGLDAGAHLRQTFNPIVSRLHTLEKPVLAAINGVVAGAGVSLALACDLRFAAESTK